MVDKENLDLSENQKEEKKKSSCSPYFFETITKSINVLRINKYPKRQQRRVLYGHDIELK